MSVEAKLENGTHDVTTTALSKTWLTSCQPGEQLLANPSGPDQCIVVTLQLHTPLSNTTSRTLVDDASKHLGIGSRARIALIHDHDDIAVDLSCLPSYFRHHSIASSRQDLASTLRY